MATLLWQSKRASMIREVKVLTINFCEDFYVSGNLCQWTVGESGAQIYPARILTGFVRSISRQGIAPFAKAHGLPCRTQWINFLHENLRD